MIPLPMPDWGRKGETWRIEPEPGGWVLTGGHGVCSGTGCSRSAVALRPARTYRGDDFLLCSLHLYAARMWVEGRRIVSWCLRP